VLTIAAPARTPIWVLDAVLGTAVLLAALLTTLGATEPGYRDVDRLAVALVLAASLPFYLRRRAPLPVFLVASLAVGILLIRGYDAGALPFALVLGAYTVGAWRPLREVVAGLVAVEALLLVIFAADPPHFDAGDLVASAVAFAAAVVVGWATQSGRRRIAGFGQERAESARQAAADERLRIAQELHDVVAHSLGVIAVQASVGMHVIESDPAEARQALEHISRMSRSSLTEIRWLLGRVRDDDGALAYAPAPGLGDLPRLSEEVTVAGLAIDLEVDGDIEAVPPGVALAAYRIVQEALTNALRHSGAHRADVRLAVGAGSLQVDVTDDGRGGDPGATDSDGHGLIGMRERAAVYGGTLAAGPGPDGGFRVHARLPYGEPSR
jgi:signal transduction histidine kinase